MVAKTICYNTGADLSTDAGYYYHALIQRTRYASRLPILSRAFSMFSIELA